MPAGTQGRRRAAAGKAGAADFGSHPQDGESTARSPDSNQGRVGRKELQAYNEGGSHQNSIEGIGVIGGQAGTPDGVFVVNGQDRRAAAGNVVTEPLWWDGEPSEPMLDGDFPNTGDRDDACGHRDAPARGFREPLGSDQPPKRDLSVEEQSHDSPRSTRATSSSTSFVKAASIRAWLNLRDRHDPRRRDGAMGTSFAIGLPFLAITISRPAAAALTSLES